MTSNIDKLGYLRSMLTADLYTGQQVAAILRAGGFPAGGRAFRDTLERAGYLATPRPDTVARWNGGVRSVLPRVGPDVLYWHIKTETGSRPDVLYVRDTFGRDEAVALALAYQRSVNGPGSRKRRGGTSDARRRFYRDVYRVAKARFDHAEGLRASGLTVQEWPRISADYQQALADWRAVIRDRDAARRHP